MDNSIISKQSQIQSLDISNGTYTTALGNQKQILTGTHDYKIQHHTGSVFQQGSGQWEDMLQITWDTPTNKPYVGIPGDLLVTGPTSLHGGLSVPFGGLTANSITTPITGFGQGQIFLDGTYENRIEFNDSGVAAPTTGSRSTGTKIVLFPSVAATQADFAIGIEPYTLWNSVVDAAQGQFKWYGGTSLAATLSGGGNLSVTGTISSQGNLVQRQLANASTSSATALFASPNIIRTLKAGNSMALSTASDVVELRYRPHVAQRVVGGLVSATVIYGQTAATVQTGRTSGQVYTLTMSTAHPKGIDYMVMVTPNNTSFVVCTAHVSSSTVFSIYCRSASGSMIDSDFYVQTIP